MINHNNKALVLFSGGQDSTTCLAWALETYEKVETISFYYGQRHDIELTSRLSVLNSIRSSFPKWDKKLGADHLIEVDFIKNFFNTALTNDLVIENTNDMPNTFVPGRNLLFFTIAAAFGYKSDFNVIVGGMSETDFSGYPDCRDSTIKSQQVTLTLGLEKNIILETPLMWKNKSQVWDFAKNIGGDALIEIIVKYTHTCYIGNHYDFHSWGYGCGDCPACVLRKNGWENWINVE
ncbi:queuosine biosynthesis protein QueC [Candidatus Kinetoplastibacterium desouzaii TCC079E]|uniref:7-cyano-7-deazaguanine synthase n=1 Tax=Candidatus Kinetoplastidibacterium desouzai TCC079E TaxID=1208919 RepID=M1LR48_9PROT|nr:7-cyano-7-deazaguanine synthase QueC [Candidatus Kinetoplastibacterium desouzaii]AGF46636.1 queuosine biosynthesis protein QueC [Candidatus Kinetoplastibacterium desouzaii TCC079E]